MFGLRLTACLALFVAGCGGNDPDVGSSTSALASCNANTDCTLPATHGTCVAVTCTNHACAYTMDDTACPTGCTAPTQAADCNLGGLSCFIVKCKPGSSPSAPGVCDFSDYSVGTGCECTAQPPMPGECAAPNSCQNAAACNSATCTYTAKQPLLGSSCCNVTSDCGGTATCAANTCGCASASDKFCAGATVGNGRCVPTTGCCLPADCPAGNACQARTCSAAGVCGVQSNGNAGCCDPASVATDCPARAHATVACTANTCVYSCDSGFHDCSGVCKDDTSPQSCGTMCSACPTGGNACQAATCSAGVCGLGAAGASPCCDTTASCTPANSCQQATACTNNMCVFASTGAAGCCNSAADCPTPTEACLQADCVANQCATTPVAGCTADLATPPAPDDLAVAVAPPDLSTPVSIAGGGGCSFAGSASSSGATAFVALSLLALALRRRRA